VVPVDETFSANGTARPGTAIETSIREIILAPKLATYSSGTTLPFNQLCNEFFGGLAGAGENVPQHLLKRSR
jgi:hypothetical protein